MSIPFVKKDAETLRAQTKGMLVALGIGNIFEGGKAKFLIDAFMELLGDLNDMTAEGIQNSNLLTAMSTWLDLKANSLAVNRVMAEGDSSLRGRAHMQIVNRQMCNDSAIDFKLRMHPRIKDVAYADFVYGSGSFAAFLDPITNTAVDSELVADANKLLQNTVARGTKFLVMSTTFRYVRMSIFATGPNASSGAISAAIERYFANLTRAAGFSIDEVRAAAVSGGARHIEFREIYVDNQRVLPRDFDIGWDEQLALDRTVPNAINVIATAA